MGGLEIHMRLHPQARSAQEIRAQRRWHPLLTCLRCVNKKLHRVDTTMPWRREREDEGIEDACHQQLLPGRHGKKKIVAELYAIVNCKWLAPCSFQLPVLTADTQTTRTTFFSQAAREQLTSSQYYTIPSSNMFEIDWNCLNIVSK